LQRQATGGATPKTAKAKTAPKVLTTSQQEAKKIMEALKTMGEDAKADWYFKESVKRKNEDVLSKRVFDQPAGFVKQEHATGQVKDEIDSYEVFDDFALRMIGLTRCKNEAEAGVLWEEALKAPGAAVVERRGQKCLGRFKGVDMLKRTSDMTQTGTQQEQTFQDAGQVADFLQSAQATHDRAEKKVCHAPRPSPHSVGILSQPVITVN
jgi:hypothetical protein